MRTWAAAVAAVLLPLPLALGGCSAHVTTRQLNQLVGPEQALPVPLSLEVAPVPQARRLPVTAEVGTTVTGGTVTSVSLTDSAGHAVPGAMRADATSWVPARPLAFGRGYQATVTATGPGGEQVTRTTGFTTMAEPGSGRIDTGLYFADGQTYGVGMPVVVEFDRDIPVRDRATVERRLFVVSDPPQVGVWHWYGGRQVLYRPERYWQPGTRLTVRAALGGLPVAGRVIDRDRSGSATIGAYQSFRVDNATKTLSVYQNGTLRKVFPVSLGKHSTPTSSGNLVIMTHQYVTVFDTPLYRITAYYDERITWDGEFFHAAPWSEGEQGRRNVSHGCVNLSVRSARWVYGMAQIGDPVTIVGTEVHVVPGDGWTVWDMPWLAYLQGSALAHPDLLAAAEAMALPESRAERLGY